MATNHHRKANAAKFEYEFLGKSVNEISETYNIPLVSLEMEIEKAGWTQYVEPNRLPETKNLQEFADQLEEMTRSKLSIISLFRQIELQPLYSQLEKGILEKAIDTISELSTMDDRIATKLLNITKTLMTIQDRNPVQLAEQLKDAASDPRIVVQIANTVN